MRKTKRWLSLGHLKANDREEFQEKPGEGQQRKKGTRWGGRAGGQQRKPPGTGQGGEICASHHAPRGTKRIDEMMKYRVLLWSRKHIELNLIHFS